MNEEGCHAIVKSARETVQLGSAPSQVVNRNLSCCQSNLKFWSQNSFGNITRKLNEVRKNLKKAKSMAAIGGDMNWVLNLKGELWVLLTQEEKLWQQRVKSAWLKDGDQNSKYFHSRAFQRFKSNEIKS